MIDWSVLASIAWTGSFAVVAADSAARGISPWFWRLASLFGGPLALAAYGIVRETRGSRAKRG